MHNSEMASLVEVILSHKMGSTHPLVLLGVYLDADQLF